MKRIFSQKLVVLLAFVCCASGAFATKYSLVDDWVIGGTNPNGVWSYGTKIETTWPGGGNFGPFQLATIHSVLNAPGDVWLDRWVMAGTYDTCNIGIVPGGLWTFPANSVIANAWENYSSVARFTVTGVEAGLYVIYAGFKGGGYAPPGTGKMLVYVQVNGVTVFQSPINDYSLVTTPWDMESIYLTPADYVDFIVAGVTRSEARASIDATLINFGPGDLPQPPASIGYPTGSTTGQYTVSWSSESRATSYQLERSSNSGSSWVQVYSYGNTSYPETVGNGSYRYRVKATNSWGSSDWYTGAWDCVVDTSSFVDKLGLAPYVWKCSGADATFRAEATMPGAYLKTIFQGSTTVGLTIDGTANTGCPASSMPVIEYSVDNNPFTIVQLTTTGSVYTLPLGSGLTSGAQHTLELYFRAADLGQNRWTASTAHFRIAGIALDSGGVLVLRSKRPALAIGYGDSITEGVGVDGQFTSWQILTPNNARGTWFPMVCSALNCEYGQLGSGGQGMVNPTLAVPPLPQTWDKYDSTSSRLTGGLLLPEPNYIFCEMGTNDSGVASQTFKDAYSAWLITARQACPNARFFCVTSPFGDGWHSADVRAIVAARNQAGDAKVYLMDVAPLVPGFKPTSGGPSLLTYDGGHPSLYGHGLLGSLITAEAQKVLSTADINHDGKVDLYDFAIFAHHWLEGVGQ